MKTHTRGAGLQPASQNDSLAEQRSEHIENSPASGLQARATFMKHLLHQFRKDWAEFRWWILGLWLLCAAYGAFIWHTLSTVTNFSTFYGSPPWWCNLADLVPMLYAGILSIRVLLADHALASNAFWRSRPLNRTAVGWAKTIFLIFCIVTPLSLTSIAHPLWFDMPKQEIFSVCIWRFLGLASLGWFLYWVAGFSDRIPFCLGVVAMIVLSYQFRALSFWYIIPQLIVPVLHWLFSLIGLRSIDLTNVAPEIVYVGWMVWGVGSILLVAICHYRTGRARSSIICALLIWCLPSSLNVISGTPYGFPKNVNVEPIPTQPASGFPEFSATITAASVVPSHSKVVQGTGKPANALGLRFNVTPPPTDYYVYPINFDESPRLDLPDQQTDLILYDKRGAREAIGYTMTLKRNLSKNLLQTHNFRYSGQPCVLDLSRSEAFDLSEPSKVKLKIGNRLEIVVGRIREIHRGSVPSQLVNRWNGYAWATSSTDSESNIDVRTYPGGAPWGLRTPFTFLSILQTGFMSGDTRPRLLAMPWDRKRQQYPPHQSGGGSDQSYQFGFRNTRQTNPHNPQSGQDQPIKWEDIDLVLYESVELGTAWIPLTMDPALVIDAPYSSKAQKTK